MSQKYAHVWQTRPVEAKVIKSILTRADQLIKERNWTEEQALVYLATHHVNFDYKQAAMILLAERVKLDTARETGEVF